jgi:hypothetical protein
MLDHKDFLITLEDLKALRQKKAQLEKEVKEVNGEIAKMVFDCVDYMDNTDQEAVKVKGIGTCSRTATKFYGIDKEEPMAAESFEQWVRDKGDWDLVTAIHSSKLQGYYKEKLELNEELPPGVKTTIKNNIVIRG